jgi:arsenate reductase-like glutaredoxin family protein
MTVTTWHNAKCATSRKVLDVIRHTGVEPRIEIMRRYCHGVTAIPVWREPR